MKLEKIVIAMKEKLTNKLWGEFLALEEKEKLLGVESLISLANYLIRNDGSLNIFKRKATKVMTKILNKYQISL